jgi:hypothetical protein
MIEFLEDILHHYFIAGDNSGFLNVGIPYEFFTCAKCGLIIIRDSFREFHYSSYNESRFGARTYYDQYSCNELLLKTIL